MSNRRNFLTKLSSLFAIPFIPKLTEAKAITEKDNWYEIENIKFIKKASLAILEWPSNIDVFEATMKLDKLKVPVEIWIERPGVFSDFPAFSHLKDKQDKQDNIIMKVRGDTIFDENRKINIIRMLKDNNAAISFSTTIEVDINDKSSIDKNRKLL